MNLNYIMLSKEEICVKFDRGRDLYEIFIILEINLRVSCKFMKKIWLFTQQIVYPPSLFKWTFQVSNGSKF